MLVMAAVSVSAATASAPRPLSLGEAVAAEVNEVSSRYAVTLAVKQQFFDVLAARESEAAARAQLEQAEYQLRSSIARLRSKSATCSDSLRSEIQRRNARLALIEARNALELANASLTRAVGSDDPITAAAADSLAPAGLALDDESIRQLAAEG